MDHLTSPKLTAGVHCLNLRHKGMFVDVGPDPDEFTFYDKYDSTGVLVQRNPARIRTRRPPVRPDCCSASAIAANRQATEDHAVPM